jgi:ABC-2 type transport system ATP-binding protein
MSGFDDSRSGATGDLKDNQREHYMIEVQGLRKHFGPVVAVRDISFSVGRGEVLGFLGPNGAGKSTTMRMITGYLSPDDGTVSIAGKAFEDDPLAAKRRIGYLPEGAPLYGDMTPLGFLRFIGSVRGLDDAAKKRRIDEVVGQVNLEPVMHRPIETLSKGFKRRVGLAQALLHDPEVLILDEPTDGLDPNQKHEVRNLIRSMAADKVVVLSTHILEEVDAVCTRALIIANGEVLADGTPQSLVSRSTTHNAVTLVLGSADSAKIETTLYNVAGVAKVEILELGAENSRLRVFPAEGQRIAAAISSAVHHAGWIVEELHVEAGELDEVFRQITTAGAQH